MVVEGRMEVDLTCNACLCAALTEFSLQGAWRARLANTLAMHAMLPSLLNSVPHQSASGAQCPSRRIIKCSGRHSIHYGLGFRLVPGWAALNLVSVWQRLEGRSYPDMLSVGATWSFLAIWDLFLVVVLFRELVMCNSAFLFLSMLRSEISQMWSSCATGLQARAWVRRISHIFGFKALVACHTWETCFLASNHCSQNACEQSYCLLKDCQSYIGWVCWLCSL